jgi:transposase
MYTKELLSRILQLQDPWYIKSVNFNYQQITIEINFKRGATFKDDNNGNDISKLYKAYDTRIKTWRHLDIMQYPCYIKARVPRIKRDDGRVRLISPPWSGIMNGFTLLFEAFILKLSKEMPVNRVADLVGVSDNKIWNMLDIYIFGAKSDEDYSHVNIVGIDETSIAKGHEYISLFVDLKKRKTMFISEGKDNKTVVNFSKDLKDHNAQAEQIKEVSCDMSPAFIKGVKENLPNANITFDKFHILKIINSGVDKVRRAEAADNPLLKNSRYVFLKNDANLTVKQRTKKEELLMPKLNLKSVRAMHIRENFQQIYLASNTAEFEYLLKKWYSWAIRSRLKPMIKVAKTIKSHWAGILRWKISQINNGILEGLNSVLQAAKRKARGYKAKHFMTIAYFLTGKLDFSKVNKFCVTHAF